MNHFCNQWWKYTTQLGDCIPFWIYEGLVSVILLGSVVFIAYKGWRKGLRYSAALIWICYISMLFSSTVFCRNVAFQTRYELTPFWSYKAISEGNEYLLIENLMNIVVFFPVGLLLSFAFRNIKWWQVGLIGLGLSLSIEILQFIFHCGFSELDDVLHNTIGCLIGGILIGIKRIYRELCYTN